MAGGKLTPRQKMINLMYLVFIAMLAMNVSKEVISAFGLMNEKFESANTSSTETNASLLQSLDQKAAEAKGEFTKALAASISELSDLSISDAMGDFVLEPKADTALEQSIVMVAAGSGITPLWSMLSSLRCWTSPVVLFYCVKNAAQAAFLTELKLLAAKQPLFELQLIETATAGRLNLVQQLKAKTSFSLSKAQYFFCGPAAMSRQYKDDLIQQGVPSTAIYAELFGLAAAAVFRAQCVLLAARSAGAGT